MTAGFVPMPQAVARSVSVVWPVLCASPGDGLPVLRCERVRSLVLDAKDAASF